MTTFLIVHETHTETLRAADLLCDVCQQVPWTQKARWCNALICADCAEGEEEPEPQEALPPTPTEAEYREWAEEKYASDDIQIDPDAKVSIADDGAWVRAWVWVDALR